MRCTKSDSVGRAQRKHIMPSLLILYPHKSQAQSDSFFKNYFSQKCSFTQFYPASNLKDHTKIAGPSPSFAKESVASPQGQLFRAHTDTQCDLADLLSPALRELYNFPSKVSILPSRCAGTALAS